MANNYTQFSFAFKAPSELAAIAFTSAFTAACAAEDDDNELAMLELSGITVEREGDTLYVYSNEETGISDTLIDLLQDYLKAHDPDSVIGFTWADWCSKPRTNEFGGGAIRIDANSVKTITTYDSLVTLIGESK